MSQDSPSIYARTYYPVFLDLHDRTAVVIGAGAVGQRKIQTLVDYGAHVVVISPETTPLVEELAKEGKITFEKRPYKKGDLDGAFLVVCATNLAEVNKEVYEEAEELGSLLNMVDFPPYCNFIVPSIVKRGPLQVAISTGGSSPVVAREVRTKIEDMFGDEWGDYLTLLGQVRSLVLSRVPGGEEARKPIFESIAASDLFDRMGRGETVSPEEVFAQFAPAEFDCKQGECGYCKEDSCAHFED